MYKIYKYFFILILSILLPNTLYATTWIVNGSTTSAYTDPDPYDNNSDITTSLTIPGAAALEITINGVTESNYDFLYITDASSNTVTFDGTISTTYTVAGDSINVRFRSDYSITRSGVTVTISSVPLPVAPDICPGTIIPNLDGTAVSATDSYNNVAIPANTTYYYYFTPTANGTIQTNSQANRSYNSLFIKDGCGTNLWSATYNSTNKSSPEISVSANQLIVIAFERRYNSSIEVDIDFTYTVPSPPIMGNIPDQNLESGTSFTLDISDYVTLTEGDPILSYTITGTLPSGISFDTSTGILSGTPTVDGTFLLYATATDKDGESNSDSFNLIITPPPPANAVDDTAYSTLIDTALVVAANGILGNDTGQGLQVTSNTSPDNGTVTVNSDGSFTYTPPSSFTGTATFQYTITDSSGNISTATVAIQVVVDTDYDSNEGFDLVNPDNTRNIIGDYKAAGNTVLCLTEERSNFATSEDQCVDTTSLTYDATSNNYIAKFIDIDTDARTWNSSSSFVTLPASYKTVLWAGLFWQGRFASSSSDIHYGTANGSGYAWVDTGSTSTFDESFLKTGPEAQNILLKIDRNSNTSATYNTVTASKIYYNEYSSGITYSARADVTYLVRQAALEQDDKVTFTIGNLPTSEGRESSPGIYGGWSLVVIYAEDLLLGKPRNITIHAGMKTLSSSSGDQTIDITGFRLPSSGNTVTASLTMFSGEGEYAYTTDGIQIKSNTDSTYQNMPSSSSSTNIFDAVMDGIDRDDIAGHKNNLQNNNVGVEVDNFDLGDIMSAYDRVNTDTLTLRMYSNNDYIIPAMLAFKTELYQPTMCYDYTLEVGGYVIPSDNNEIQTNIGAFTNAPMVTRLSIQSREGDYDFQDVNLTYALVDTNDTQYNSGTTAIAKNEQFAYVDASGQTINEQDKGFLLYLGEGASGSGGGTIQPYQKRFIKFDNTINSDVDTQFNLLVQYTVDFGGTTRAHIAKALTADDYCRDGGGYFIASDIFNVTSDAADDTTGQAYNLFTQVVNRPFDVKVFSHDIDYINTDHRLKAADTAVEVEVFNADFFPRDVNLSCLTPDSNISDSSFVDFRNTTNVLMTNLTIDYAVRNAGFRTWYLKKPDGSVVSHHCTDQTDQSCFQTVYTDSLKTYETADKNCTSICSSASGCYGCLRQYYGNPVCSKDNFAIRPEAFVVDLKDNNQQTDSTQPSIRIAHSANQFGFINDVNVSAGYNYRFDVNATNYNGDIATNGYYRTFNSNSTTYTSTMRLWNKTAIVSAGNCNDTADKNVTFTLFNGSNVNNYQNTNEIGGINQVGLYEFIMRDSNWTVVDWHPSETIHHSQTGFNTIDDCLQNDGTVPNAGQPGCEIRNNHYNNGTRTQYNELNVTFNPYDFNIGLNASSPINNVLVYINTLDNTLYPNGIDENMSYNIQGTFSARGWASTRGSGTQLSNFVAGCFANNVDMNLTYVNLNPVPTSTTTMRRDIYDYNNSTVIRAREDALSDNAWNQNTEQVFTIGGQPMNQLAQHFSKAMQGTIRMDLGLNFDRTNNVTLNPRKVQFNDFNISYQTNANINVDMQRNHKIYGNLVIDQNVTFAYARVKPSKTLYDDITTANVDTPISVVLYCSLGYTECQNRGILALLGQTNDANWWKSVDHSQAAGNGNIELSSTPSSALNSTTVNITTNGVNDTVNVNNGGVTPLTVPVNLIVNDPANPPVPANYTDRWLIFNPASAVLPPVPFYRVRFIGNTGWAGYGDTGHVVGGTINQKKNKRLEW